MVVKEGQSRSWQNQGAVKGFEAEAAVRAREARRSFIVGRGLGGGGWEGQKLVGGVGGEGGKVVWGGEIRDRKSVV